MLKRYFVASLVAGLALGAQSAVADSLWFYEGHGWLAQPPFSSERDSRSASVIAAPSARQAVNPKTRANFCEPSGNTHPERPLEQCGY